MNENETFTAEFTKDELFWIMTAVRYGKDNNREVFGDMDDMGIIVKAFKALDSDK